jgi:hypothetical protein
MKGWFLIAWWIAILINLAIVGVLVWVAIHFICKFW